MQFAFVLKVLVTIKLKIRLLEIKSAFARLQIGEKNGSTYVSNRYLKKYTTAIHSHKRFCNIQ